MSDIKEVHHFDNDRIDWTTSQDSELHRHFNWNHNDVIRGEATPIYTYWPNSITRLRKYNPSAKLIIGLRQPALRAFSHWKMEYKRGFEPIQSFSDATSQWARDRVRFAPAGVHRVFSYVERGYYAPQIRNVLAHFPRENIHFFRTETLWLEPARTIGAVLDFLGLATPIPTTANAAYIVSVDTRGGGQIGADDFDKLTELFADDIEETAKLTNLELSN